MGYLTLIKVNQKDILLSPLSFVGTCRYVNIKTWGCSVVCDNMGCSIYNMGMFCTKNIYVVQSPIKGEDCRPVVFC